jgi:predicted MFS family arabinose efflux permease
VFWSFFAIAVIYAFAEGTFSNWIVVYLQDGKHLPAATATTALSAFWGALVAGRLLVSALVLRVAPQRVWIALPVAMAVAFLALPHATSAELGVGLFVLSGLACSAFFPLSIALVTERFPHQVPWVSSMMIAALMTGVGAGSFAVGALRARLPFETLYAWSALYPAAVLLLAALTVLRRPGARLVTA